MRTIILPAADGRLTPYAVAGVPVVAPAVRGWNRVAYSAAHVVAAPLADNDPWLDESVDWDATLAYRHYLLDLGLGVAEAMDTAQRGMGLSWGGAQDLIRRSLAAARGRDGAKKTNNENTNQLAPQPGLTLDDVIRAYE